MARIEDLIDEIPDAELRNHIAREVKQLKSTKRFGLVYEEHVPETVSLFGLPIRPGAIVQTRTQQDDQVRWEVVSVEGDTADVVPVGVGGPPVKMSTRDLLTVKRFEEPIYPGLTDVGEVRRGPAEKPVHSVISGENYHALQLLAYTHAGKVDVIYIDPPYNTGDKSWKYNNRFVDGQDAYRHSRWLAMMEKRLRLAKTLLRPDGALIVTIDEHEVHNLGVLLQDLFKEARLQMVTIVNNAAGVSQGGFYRVEEHAMYLFFGGRSPVPVSDDHLADSDTKVPIWRPLNRYSGTNVTAAKRPGLVYPVTIDTTRERIAGTGRTLKDRIESGEVNGNPNDWRPAAEAEAPDRVTLWPFRGDGSLSTWELSPETLLQLASAGFVRVLRRGDAFSVSYVKTGNRRKVASGKIETLGREPDEGPLILGGTERQVVPKTVWRRPAHDAGKWGSRALREFLGALVFDYAKSPYAVFDTLDTLVRNRPNAVILDFFAGSGTTLHSVAMLNARDQGRRQCILITNNDVSGADAETLAQEGHRPGDVEYESRGIFEAITKPRVQAVITGVRPDGAPVEGSYLEQYLPNHNHASGFEENVVFLRMDYLEPDLVELGRQYAAIAPLLWMTAGSIGSWEPWDGESAWSAPDGSTYAVLFDEAQAAAFAAYVASRSEELSHAWIVTNSHSAFLDLRIELPTHVVVGQLYRDYLRNFVVNAPRVLP